MQGKLGRDFFFKFNLIYMSLKINLFSDKKIHAHCKEIRTDQEK